MDEPPVVRVSHGEATDKGEYWHIARTEELADGSFKEGCHLIAKDAMEWRAAEYGIPAEDLTTLLDVILMEPYLTPEEWAEGVALHVAGTVAEARAAHLARIVKCKLRLRVSTQSKTPDKVRAIIKATNGGKDAVITFLDIVRAGSPMDEEILKDKRQMVRDYRRSLVQDAERQKPTRRERFRKEVDKRKEQSRG